MTGGVKVPFGIASKSVNDSKAHTRAIKTMFNRKNSNLVIDSIQKDLITDNKPKSAKSQLSQVPNTTTIPFFSGHQNQIEPRGSIQ